MKRILVAFLFAGICLNTGWAQTMAPPQPLQTTTTTMTTNANTDVTITGQPQPGPNDYGYNQAYGAPMAPAYGQPVPGPYAQPGITPRTVWIRRGSPPASVFRRR